MMRARDRVDSLFPGARDRYEEWTLLGDPELNVWTGRPRPVAVTYDTVIETGQQDFAVTVRSNGSPVDGAVVCAWMDSVVYACDSTGVTGEVVLAIDPTHNGVMSVVVSGRNLLPHEGACRAGPAGIAGEPPGPTLRTGLECIPPCRVGRDATVRYVLADAARVELTLFDASGRSVGRAVGGVRPAGRHAERVSTAQLGPGVCFCRMAVAGGAGTQWFTRKLLLLE